MTNREIIERVKRMYYEKNTPQANKILSNRQIFNKLVSARNRVIAQEAGRNNLPSDFSYQSLQVSLVDNIEGFDTSIYAPNVKKSLLTIPEILSDGTKPLIKLVGDVGGKNTFYKTTWDQKKNILGNKYIYRKIFYYIYNDYLYILNNNKLDSVVITAVFADFTFENINLPILDRRFIADARIIDNIVALTIEELAGKKIPQPAQEQQA